MGNLRQSQTRKTLTRDQSLVSGSRKPTIHPIEELQGIIGNRALGQLIKSQPDLYRQVHRSQDPLLSSVSPVNGQSIQRQPMFRGLSHELMGNWQQGNPVQAKLTIGEAGDKYELEADRVASEVVDRINTPVSSLSTQPNSIQPQHQQDELIRKPMVQLQSVEGGMAATPELETSIQQARGSGMPIAESIRKPMEQSFGADFSGVRVHADAQSDQLNQSIQARAFTTGKDIFFRQGEYNPGSRGGQELIAHELTHIVQQAGGTGKLQAQPDDASSGADPFEGYELKDMIKDYEKYKKFLAVVSEEMGQLTYRLNALTSPEERWQAIAKSMAVFGTKAGAHYGATVAGGVAGAAVGSVVAPGLGTVLGALVGGVTSFAISFPTRKLINYFSAKTEIKNKRGIRAINTSYSSRELYLKLRHFNHNFIAAPIVQKFLHGKKDTKQNATSIGAGVLLSEFAKEATGLVIPGGDLIDSARVVETALVGISPEKVNKFTEIIKQTIDTIEENHPLALQLIEKISEKEMIGKRPGKFVVKKAQRIEKINKNRDKCLKIIEDVFRLLHNPNITRQMVEIEAEN